MQHYRTRMMLALEMLHQDETGQDLVEYAMVAAVIALGAVASMSVIAREINNVFSTLARKFASSQP
jgi:pilus assembly protein Flp/PilA